MKLKMPLVADDGVVAVGGRRSVGDSGVPDPVGGELVWEVFAAGLVESDFLDDGGKAVGHCLIEGVRAAVEEMGTAPGLSVKEVIDLEHPIEFGGSVGSEDQNSTFRLFTINAYEFFHIYIYNRRGELVFDSDDPEFVWDGTMDGKPCPQGTYVYVCRFRKPGTNNLAQLHGSVTLVR